jgi:branched-chain amino acid transport system substrate-binding protein
LTPDLDCSTKAEVHEHASAFPWVLRSLPSVDECLPGTRLDASPRGGNSPTSGERRRSGLQAQSSGSKIVGLANAGGDTINSIKQAAEFGIVESGQKLAGLLVFISDIHSLSLEVAQWLQLTEAFYWDLNDDTRAWSERWSERMNGRMPTSIQAGYYSSITHYLKAVEALGADSPGDVVVAKMKEMPTEDPLFGKGHIRIDGRKMHDMYLFEVKAPSDSQGPWDYYELVRTIPGDRAFRPLDQGGCSLVK